jgi:hypothetical protein
MSKALSFIAGAGLGAAGMYFFDPRLGARRRANVEEKLFHYGRETGDTLGGLAQEAAARAFGTVMELRYQLDRRVPSDQVLEARAKTKLGRIVTHPGAIRASARDGEVTLSGPILAGEVDRAVMSVRLIPGVTQVVDLLEVHRMPESFPVLQPDQPERVGMKR